MATADVFFNWEQDAAAIRINHDSVAPYRGFATSAVNQAIAVLFGNSEDIRVYQYEVWNGFEPLGLLWAGNFDPPEGDIGDAVIRASFDKIIKENEDAPHEGDIAPIYGISI